MHRHYSIHPRLNLLVHKPYLLAMVHNKLGLRQDMGLLVFEHHWNMGQMIPMNPKWLMVLLVDMVLLLSMVQSMLVLLQDINW
jgi:hypothetical protein